MGLHQEKQQLREQFFKARKALSGQAYQQKSERIIDALVKQPEFLQASSLHCYVAMEERREVNTKPLIEKLLKTPKRLAVPVVDFQTQTLNSFYIDQLQDLQKNRWGVLEPDGGTPADPAELDLVIVPMVGGDEKRNRIGYGMGFYDRFLSTVNCPTVGLLFECCLAESIPVEEFDIALDKVITEKRVIG